MGDESQRKMESGECRRGISDNHGSPKEEEFIAEILSKLSQMTAASTECAPVGDPAKEPGSVAASPSRFTRPYSLAPSQSGNMEFAYQHRGLEAGYIRGSTGYNALENSISSCDVNYDMSAPVKTTPASMQHGCEAYTQRSLAVTSALLDGSGGGRQCWTSQGMFEARQATDGCKSYDSVSDREAFTLLASRVRRGGSQTHLWEFLLELLTDPNYTTVVSWENEEGTFCIKNPAELATIWGHRRKRQNMTYEKLSRSLRHYYDKKILRKVPKRKYTYRFNCKEILRTYDVPPAFRYHHQFRKRAIVTHGKDASGGGALQDPLSPSSPLSALRASLPSPGLDSLESADSPLGEDIGGVATGSTSVSWPQCHVYGSALSSSCQNTAASQAGSGFAQGWTSSCYPSAVLNPATALCWRSGESQPYASSAWQPEPDSNYSHSLNTRLGSTLDDRSPVAVSTDAVGFNQMSSVAQHIQVDYMNRGHWPVGVGQMSAVSFSDGTTSDQCAIRPRSAPGPGPFALEDAHENWEGNRSAPAHLSQWPYPRRTDGHNFQQ